MHRTNAGEKRKALRKEALELEREARTLEKIEGMSSGVRGRQDEAGRLRAEAEPLRTQARLEDLHIWKMEKSRTTKKGSKNYDYWMASWREGGKVRNIHLGSARKLSQEAARQKARVMTAEGLTPES